MSPNQIVSALLDEAGETSQPVVVQFVSPNNTFWWYSGEAGNAWTREDTSAKQMLHPEAQDVVDHYETVAAYRGRIGIVPAKTAANPGV